MLISRAHARSSSSVPVFAPTDIAGLKLWLKADALALANNAAVSSWTDSSSSANHAAQATGSLQPLFKTAIINGKPVVRFDGSNDALLCASSAGTIKHVFVVAKFSDTAFHDYPGLLTDVVNPAVLVGETETVNFYDFSGSYRYNRAASVSRQAPMNTFALITVSFATGWSITPEIGRDRDNPRWWNGDVAEVLLYDSVLSGGNQTSVENHLATKYALP